MCQARFKILMGSILFSLLTNFFSFFPDRGPASAFEELAMPLTRMACPPDRDPAQIEKCDRNLPGDLWYGSSCEGFCHFSPLQTISTEDAQLSKCGGPVGFA